MNLDYSTTSGKGLRKLPTTRKQRKQKLKLKKLGLES